MCRRNKSYNNKKEVPVPHRAAGGPLMEMNPVPQKNVIRAREFPMSSIRFLQELGEGAFGKVYKGELNGYHGENIVTKVAIKTLKENAAPKIKNDFRREVDLMTDLKHSNIVCLLGVCMKQEPMCMLFEYMENGDLHEFLIMHSPHSDVSVSDDEGAVHNLDHSDMLHIATQIVAGMEYLAGHHFVHRDLAARNILVGDNLTVKISDFGLSRDVYSSDYYRVQSKSLLPVRWMPPESILYGKFTVESDVWSFGVVLWEIFSYGLQPYYGYSNQEVIEMIRSRQILPCPDECPARMYAMMVECWHEMPSRRPLFKELHSRLRAWKGEAMSNLNPNISMAGASHSGHSSSTGQSGTPSHFSHHSSNIPSNNTTTTGLSSGSQGQPMPPHIQYQPMPFNMRPQPAYQQQQALQQHHQQQQQPVPLPPPPYNHLNPVNQMNLYNMAQNQRPMNVHQQQMAQRIPMQEPQSGAMNMGGGVAMAGGGGFGGGGGGGVIGGGMNTELYKKPSPPGSEASHKSSSSSSHASSASNYKPSPQPLTSMNIQQLNNPRQTNVKMPLHSPTGTGNNKMATTNTSPMYIPDPRTSEIWLVEHGCV